eukprot:COSAG02_NODE_611_length_19555_cov_34.449270_21_plen_100_part_00
MRFVLVHSHLALVRSPIASLLTHAQRTTWLSKANSSLYPLNCITRRTIVVVVLELDHSPFVVAVDTYCPRRTSRTLTSASVLLVVASSHIQRLSAEDFP